MDKNTFISNKIKSLMQEGKKQNQAIAIAYSSYNSELDKMQKGGSLDLKDKNNPAHYKATLSKNIVPTTTIDGVEYEVSRLGALREKGTLAPTEFGAVAKTTDFAKASDFEKGVVEVGQNKLDPNRDAKSLFELNRGWILDAQGNRVRKVELPEYENFYQEGGELPYYQDGTNSTQGKFQMDLRAQGNPEYYTATTANKNFEQVPTFFNPSDGKTYEISKLGTAHPIGSLEPTPFGAVKKGAPVTRTDSFQQAVQEISTNKSQPNRDARSLFELNRGWVVDDKGNRIKKINTPTYENFYQEGGEIPKYQYGAQANPFMNTLPSFEQPFQPQPINNYPNNINPQFAPYAGNINDLNNQQQSFNFPSYKNPTNNTQGVQTNNVQTQQEVVNNATPNTNSSVPNGQSVDNSGAFYQQRFQNFNPFGAQQFPSDLGYEQGSFLGKDPNYENQLSPNSLTAGQDFKDNNQLPEGVMEKDLGFDNNNPNKKQTGEGQNDYTKYNILNPYGGVSPTAGLQYGLYNLGAGNGGKAALGLGRAGLGFLREGLSAYGAGKNYKEGKEEYLDKQFNQAPKYEYLKEGGEVSIAEMMTGNYLGEVQDANVEVEAGEYTKNAETGNIQEAVGEKHNNGGVKTQLPDGSQVLSDFTKIGKDNAKLFSDTYGIKIKAAHTFSDVMDKFKKKSGLEKLEKEEVETMEMLEKQLKTDISENTKQINLDFLGKELQEIEAKKGELKKQQDEAFKTIFEEQEKIPKKGEVKEFQEGGEIPQEQSVPQQEGMDIVQQVSVMLQQGVPPEQVIEQLIQSGVSHQEAMQMVQEAIQQGQQVDAPVMQEGGYTFSTRLAPTIEGYDVSGRSVLNQDELSGVENIQPYTGQGYGAKMSNVEDTIKVHDWYFDTEEKKQAFREASKKEGKQPEVLSFQKAYNNKIRDKAKQRGLSETDIKNTINQVGFSDEGVQKLDGKFGAFTSTRPLYDFSKKEGKVETIVKLPEVDLTDTEGNPINRNKSNTKNIIPMLPYFAQMTPSQMMMPKRQQVDLSRIEPNKIGVEPNLAEAERARLARSQSYEGLSPEVAAVMRSADLATTQQANNTAISTAEVANRDAQNKADQFNASQRDREQLTNLGLDKQYEREVFATVNNQERDWRDYYNANDAQRKADYNTIEEANLLNAMTPNYQYVPGQGVDFVNPYMFANNTEDVKNKQISAELANAKTGEEYAKIRDKYFGQMQTNTSKNK